MFKQRLNICVRTPNGLADDFERLYPKCSCDFIRRCMYLALSDKSFFDSVFFNKSVYSYIQHYEEKTS